MNGLIMAAQLILGLSVLVLIHELGHYLAARAFGIRVEKFYLFFDAWGKKIFKFKKGDTEYGIGWLPLGGYVKISGMIDESLDKSVLKNEPQPWEFRSKPAWQRLIVMIAGVLMNVVLGILIFTFILLFSTKGYVSTDEVNKHGIYAYETAREFGFQTGDKIIKINDSKIKRFDDLVSANTLFGADVTIERDGKQMVIAIPDTLYKMTKQPVFNFIAAHNTPFVVDMVMENSLAQKNGIQKQDTVIAINDKPVKSYGAFREEIEKLTSLTIQLQIKRGGDTISKSILLDSTKLIGVASSYPYEPTQYSVSSAFYYGTFDAISTIVLNVKGLKKIFSGEEKARDSVSGPIGIAQIYGANWIWLKFWYITGLLSMVLAFMNILPIPALDGGHVILLTFEVITGKKIPDNAMEKIQIAGMIILLTLMVYVIGNDILKLFNI